MAYAQLITHSPEQTEKWRGLVISNPGRLIRTQKLAPGGRTREGDDESDIWALFEVLKEITKSLQKDKVNTTWSSLVDAGVAEALCSNVRNLVMMLRFLPTMPKDLLEKAQNEIQSPYYKPLEILCNVICSLQFPLSPTDKKVLAALRKNWSGMMERLWKEPHNTTRPENSHLPERLAVATLIVQFTIHDPSILSTFYDPKDLTIQVLARLWKHGNHPVDLQMSAAVLAGFLKPQHPRHVSYVNNNGLESALPQVITKILAGVSPAPSSSKPKQLKALMTTFGEHLVQLSGISVMPEMDLFYAILTSAKKGEAEPEVTRTLVKSTAFWSALFRLLKKSAKPAVVDPEQVVGEPLDAETEKKHRLVVIARTLSLSASVLHGTKFDNPNACEPLACIWANENFFGALEETIELALQSPGMTFELCRIGAVFGHILTNGTPSTRRLLRTQLPRWRIISSLLINDMKRQEELGVPPAEARGTTAPPESLFWDQPAWQVFVILHFDCIDFEKECVRRGCGNAAGDILCDGCKTVRYCSESCQTKDAKDHQHCICGNMEAFKQIDRQQPRAGLQPLPTQSEDMGVAGPLQGSLHISPPTTNKTDGHLADLD